MKKNTVVSDLEHIRHSLAHLLAASVLELWPDTKHAIGPAIADGFYFDFEFGNQLLESDLSRIEAKMRELLPTWEKFERVEMSVADAKECYKNNPYKRELIDEFAQNGTNNRITH